MQFFSEFITSHRQKLFLDGFTIIKKKNISNLDNFLKKVNNLENNLGNFENQKKQNGAYTLKPSVQERNKELFLDTLFLSNIFESCCLIAGQQLYLTNFKHYLTKGKTPALGWHRDTYYRKNKFTGLIPTGYKLAIYTTNTTKTDGCTAFVKGSHMIYFNNKYFDYFLTYFSNKIRKVELDKGDAILFNVNLIHNRLKAKTSNSYRSVTIYGFALSKHYQESYLRNNNESIINYFNNELENKISW
jgi:hypothetical protein